MPGGEDPLEGAKRELLEETGLVASHWQPLLQMHLSNSVSDELAIVYLATGLTQHKPNPKKPNNFAEKNSICEAWRMVEEGRSPIR
jgi:8-oxo-dGTP pyrophosphatase MutT (NUDIX family)